MRPCLHRSSPMRGYAADLTAGWRDTRALIALRWRTVRSPGGRGAIVIAAALFAGLLAILANFGYVVRIASLQTDTAAGIFARVWIEYLAAGIMGVLGSAAVGSAVIIALFAPFTGTATLSFTPQDDLVGVRPNPAHRYFDSLLLNAISALGLLQLMALTVVASLLTLDGQHAGALLFTWIFWFALIALMTLIGWLLEWVVREYGKRLRPILAVASLGLVGLIVALDPDKGTTLFGLAKSYTSVIRAGIDSWTSAVTWSLVGVSAVATFLILAGFAVARVANSKPVPVQAFTRTRRPRTLGRSPFMIAFRLMARTMWRTSEVRRPLVSLILIGVPAISLAQLSTSTEMTVTFAVPVTIALSWATNAFALLGPGMAWVASQPKIMNHLPVVSAIAQGLLSLGVLAVIVLVAAAAGQAEPGTVVRTLTAAPLATFMCVATALTLSIHRPLRSRLSGRGDALIPPGTALAYTAIFIVAAGAPLAAINLVTDGTARVAVLVLAVAIPAAIIAWNLRRWQIPQVRARVVSAVGGD
jgi:TM2 domain-containing membrane protein YozV